MCGRIAQTFSSRELIEHFHLAGAAAVAEARYNIAPSQPVAAVREDAEGRSLVELRWGLVPFWAKEAKIGYRMFNARAETVHSLPAFKAAFRSRRCLVPVAGFYEWAQTAAGKQPWHIRRADGKPLALAGLWERWQEPEGVQTLESCTILTCAAAREMAALHERMPVILEPEDFARWLDPAENRVERLRGLLQPAAAGVLELFPVSSYVNKTGNEGPRCMEPAAP